jgi:hypothetical protein
MRGHGDMDVLAVVMRVLRKVPLRRKPRTLPIRLERRASSLCPIQAGIRQVPLHFLPQLQQTRLAGPPRHRDLVDQQPSVLSQLPRQRTLPFPVGELLVRVRAIAFLAAGDLLPVIRL